MRIIIVFVALTLLAQSPAHALNCALVYDEFDHLMNKSFLQNPAAYTTGKEGQFSRVDYLNQAKQFRLYPQRKNYGIAVFRTNNNTRGKFLFTWQRQQAGDTQPTLFIKKLVTYGRVTDGSRQQVRSSIAVKSSFTLDLDTGRQGSGEKADIWFNNVNGREMYIKAVNGADIFFPIQSLCQENTEQQVQLIVPIQNAPTAIVANNNEKRVTKRELLDNGHILISYSDGSKRELFNGGIVNILPDGQRQELLFSTAAPVDLPGEPPTGNEREWLEFHRSNLLNIITSLVDNPDLVDEFINTVDNSDNIYESIATRSQVIERLIQN